MNRITWAGVSIAAGLAAFGIVPASGQSDEIKGAIVLCENGVVSSCLNAAKQYRAKEDPENPEQTLRYAKMACDSGSSIGCRYYALNNYRAALVIHQRIVKATISGDPKGVWKYKSDLNAAVDRAVGYYRTAQEVDATLNDDWPKRYADLENLRQ